MQQQGPSVASSGKIALRYGLIFGLIQAAIDLIASLLNTFVLSSNGGVIFVLNGLVFLTGLAAYFIAGMLASRQTGKVSTGTISGLWTGVFFGVIGCIISTTLYMSVTLPKLISQYDKTGYPSNVSQSAFKVGLVAGGIGLYILGLFLAIGVGAGIGALGGLLGRSQARKAAPPQPYPGQPYAGPPQGQPYPPQPYPNQPFQGQSYPGQPQPYTQPYPGQQTQPSEQPAAPPPADWNPYNSDQPR